MKSSISTTNLQETLKNYFGFEHFRANQKEIIESVLSNKDTLAIMPTGGGKSICFQLPALVFDKLTIVVSPLIALMKDQVDGLKANGIEAEYINSTLNDSSHREILEKIANKKLKLLYIAPESLQYIDHIINERHISMIAIDEAHCISSWGHDFRPAYIQLGYLKERLPNTPILALTATADKATREDIANQLNLQDPNKFIASFNRPNLYLEIRSGQDRIKQIVTFINQHNDESGIIYCLSRKSTEDLATKLNNSGIRAGAYHAGLSAEKRSSVQEEFINDEVQVMCATIAFGMGIDKSNVRWVIHYNMPKNIEGYYQEIGRAGRDGLASDTLLFYSFADVVQLRKFAEDSSNKEFQLAKLERMQQFAESLNCRRKALLSYFGESLSDNCGNCDNCKNPPSLFDGTVIAQKALSAVTRLKEEETLNNIVDFLRGSSNAYVVAKGYQYIKTYGVGKDLSWKDWVQYMIQLLNQGYCEIAFHDGNKLKLTSLSKQVLFEGKPVILAHNVEKSQEKKSRTKKEHQLEDSLFEALRKLRLSIAKKEGVPPYIVFNDATLKEMAAHKPTYDEAFMDINGVGKAKLEKYGDLFINEILNFERNDRLKKVNTYEETWRLYQQAMTVAEIADSRNLNQATVFSHLCKLYQDGKPIDLEKYLDNGILEKVMRLYSEIKDTKVLKPYFDHYNGQIPYEQIRIALTILSN
ncbi:MAG: DNA helicase RecQ [Flavobacteriales bacterium]|nr:DNA helicase RecQ [Flavobacteriales bacterium]